MGNWHVASINFQELDSRYFGKDPSPQGTGGNNAGRSPARDRNARSKAGDEAGTADFHLNSGFGMGGGASVLPLMSGWKADINAGIFFEIGLGKVVALGGALDFLAGSGMVHSGNQAPAYHLGISFFTKLGYAFGESRDFYFYPYLILEPTLGLNVSSLVPSALATNAEDASMVIGGSAGIGLELGFGGIAIGVEGRASGVSDNTRLRLNAIPLKFFIVF
jgi:hypothetical protein